CMYPITGSARTIRSPSSFSTTRSTPWVEGCCGPMLRIISSVRSGPSATTSMPPPRSIQASLAAVYAARCWVSRSITGRVTEGHLRADLTRSTNEDRRPTCAGKETDHVAAADRRQERIRQEVEEVARDL